MITSESQDQLRYHLQELRADLTGIRRDLEIASAPDSRREATGAWIGRRPCRQGRESGLAGFRCGRKRSVCKRNVRNVRNAVPGGAKHVLIVFG